ncbi:MAG: phosphoribosylformimino-5-aminoimidazole carboxamide ribotide isomerase [Lachnospiraceae bacterium]|nr:phosphoribosylformimino-5-aminoimidazole carboxamide ribotide isomerase [Lachnospiraceae bacterium]
MQFRPCIDIHNGAVKQIVGGSLKDVGNQAKENFVSKYNAAFYAKLYQKYHLKGGHIILLNNKESEYFEATKAQAIEALKAYPGGLMIGGGIDADNALEYLEAGASHVIVTSYVFKNGDVNISNLKKLVNAVGKEHVVLDLSCRKIEGEYRIMTDRWQKASNVILNHETLNYFKDYCDEFLIHAVDVEGKNGGIEEDLVMMLGDWAKIPMTYAGGVHNFYDLELLRGLGRGKIDVTVGSALDLFGGSMEFEKVLDYME